jgi:hypothetical protein
VSTRAAYRSQDPRGEEPDVESPLAQIANLDRHDVVMPESPRSASPIALAPEVGDDHDERALASKRAGLPERSSEIGRLARRRRASAVLVSIRRGLLVLHRWIARTFLRR